MRTANDFYETPPWQTRALLKRFKPTDVLCECCSGDRSISDFFPLQIWTNDIDPARYAQFHLDAADPQAWKQFPPVDWTITNPPFSHAMPILKNAFHHSRLGVILLLRLSFMEPTIERGDWLVEHPPQFQFILPRWSYKQNGSTDSVTTAWFIWDKTARLFEAPPVYKIHPIQIVPRSEMEAK